MSRHSERCSRCKSTIGRLLKTLYGDVRVNHRFDVGTRPEDLRMSPFREELRTIFLKLQQLRGFHVFVKASMLPAVDFFVPSPGFIVEFDETQHFTACRRESLLLYPRDLRTGFDVERWIRLCEQIRARDNDPPYRDEQRAWYDTMRDFLPSERPFKPTVRLFSKDAIWCDLDPEDDSDVRAFTSRLDQSPSRS